MGLVGDGLCEQGLSGTRGAKEDDASGRLDAEVLEDLRLGQGPLDALLEPVLDLVQAANFVPADFWNFDVNFAKRRGFNITDGFLEVLHVDLHLLEHFGRDGFRLKVDFWEVAAKGLHRGLAHQGAKVGADETVGVVHDPSHVEVVRDGHLTGVDFHDFPAAFAVGHADLDFAVETTGPAEGGVEGVLTVGGADDDDVFSALHAVHEGQHLRHDAALDFT